MPNGSYPTLRQIAPGPSCAACKRRKIRCDRSHPCAYCVRLGGSCDYPIKTARKHSDRSGVSKAPRSLVRGYERENDSQVVFAPNLIGTNPRAPNGRLVPEGSHARFVRGGLWVDLDDECPLGTKTRTEPEVANAQKPSMQHESFLFGHSSLDEDLSYLHPSEDRIFSIWQLYLNNVDPLLRLCHNPTVQRQILDASSDIRAVPPNFASLMFAIYYSVASSLQCLEAHKNVFGSERQELLVRYSGGVEKALAKAHFMREPDICSLQALTLYLTCARHSISRTYIWTMVGLAIRLATRMGLHRDPSTFQLGLLESDIRRRLWWQIVILDVHTAEENDLDPSIYEHGFDTKFPTVVYDQDPDASSTKPSDGEWQSYSPDIVFALRRIQISYAARKVLFSEQFALANGYAVLSSAEKIDFLDKLQADLKLDLNNNAFGKDRPVNDLVEVAGDLIMAKMKLELSYHGSKESLESLRTLIEQSIEILHATQKMRKVPTNHKWTWLFQRYIEWGVFAILLRGLGITKCPDLQHRARPLVETFFNDWSDHVPDKAVNERWRQLEAFRVSAETG